MQPLKLTILGSGSSVPNIKTFQSSQVLEYRAKRYMIDCGESAQIGISRFRVGVSQLNNIFISHLHCDHCVGLVGLFSTLAMVGKNGPITVHAHKDLKTVITPMLNYFIDHKSLKVEFNDINPKKAETIYEDNGLIVRTIPLKHRVPTCGFLFEEKQGERHISKAMIDAFGVPKEAIKGIKQGADFIDSSGFLVKNEKLTLSPSPIRKYAYCSDTAYNEKIVEQIWEADLLFHEATFLEADAKRAKDTMHSTSVQAATIAKLANVKQLVLGHFSSRYKNRLDMFLTEAKSVFDNTILANDGLTVDI